MSVLITGGAGFIGSHLAEELLESGEEVYVVDDLSTGSMDNISHLVSHPRFYYQIDTIMNERLMERIIQRVDMVYHLAAAVGVKLIVEEPIKCITTNIMGSILVLQLAYELGKKKVLIASTSEIYGKSTNPKFSEEDDRILGPTTKLRWSYSTSKAVDEYMGLIYAKKKKLPVVIARIFNTVGPRQTGRYGMVIPRFVKQALDSRPITVFGDGRQMRCFLHVNDLVRVLTELSGRPEAVGQIFNVGSTQTISIKDLAQKVKQMTGSQSEIVYIPYEEAYEEGFEDMLYRAPDISKLNRLIGFQPAYDLDQILESVIEYYRSGEALSKE